MNNNNLLGTLQKKYINSHVYENVATRSKLFSPVPPIDDCRWLGRSYLLPGISDCMGKNQCQIIMQNEHVLINGIVNSMINPPWGTLSKNFRKCTMTCNSLTPTFNKRMSLMPNKLTNHIWSLISLSSVLKIWEYWTHSRKTIVRSSD